MTTIGEAAPRDPQNDHPVTEIDPGAGAAPRVVVVRVQHTSWEVVAEVALTQDVASVARRMRQSGLAARKVGNEIHVNALAELQR